MKRIVFGLTLSLVVACFAGSVTARDLDGRYANSPLKQWFDNLKSGRGLCCSMAGRLSDGLYIDGQLPPNATGAPITYIAGGKQYIAFPVGEGPIVEELIVVSL